MNDLAGGVVVWKHTLAQLRQDHKGGHRSENETALTH